MKKAKKFGFTLVELIITITILAILSVISFLNFGNYTGTARNISGLSDLKNIEKSLNLNYVETGKYLLPTGGNQAEEINGIAGLKWIKGKFGEEQFQELKRLNKLPVDPETKENYDYYVSEDRKFYILKSINGENILTNYTGVIGGLFNNSSSSTETSSPEYIPGENGNHLIYDKDDKNFSNPFGITESFYILKGDTLKWLAELSRSKFKWSNNYSFGVPVWNNETQTYDFPEGRVAEDYPAINFCVKKGIGWRLPTKEEILKITSETKDSRGIYTKLFSINNYTFWTGETEEEDNRNAFYVTFNKPNDNFYSTGKLSSHSVVCVHE